MSSHTFDDLYKAVGRTIGAISIREDDPNKPDYLLIEFKDGSELVVNSSEWLADMEFKEPNV